MTADTYGHLFPRGDDGSELAAAERAFLAGRRAGLDRRLSPSQRSSRTARRIAQPESALSRFRSTPALVPLPYARNERLYAWVMRPALAGVVAHCRKTIQPWNMWIVPHNCD